MFRLLCKKLTQNVYTAQNSTRNNVVFLQTHSLKSNSKSKNQHSPTVSYLITKCGLSLDSAISASQKIHIETTEKPDSVLQLFKSYDFTQTQISNLVTLSPSVILADPVNTLKPKFEFFESLGLSKPDVARIISSNNRILFRSLNNQIIPTFNFLKSFIHNNEAIITALVRCAYVATGNFYKQVEPNIEVLRDLGVPELNIGKLLMLEPRAIAQKNARFKEIVSVVEKMGFNRQSRSFVAAIGTMGAMDKSRWEKKLVAYKSFGWSEEDVISAFKMQPSCMLNSEMKIRKLMDFYLNELGLTVSDVTKHPNLMLISLEKRIIPRCSVLQLLLSSGVIEKDFNLMGDLNLSKKLFEKKYVNKYQEIAPEVLKAYQGELGYPRLETLRPCVD